MTTIACNTSSMACDLQMTYGTQKFKTTSKILELTGDIPMQLYGSKRVFIGFAGIAEQWGRALEWFRDTREPLPKLKKIEFLMLNDKKQILTSSNLRYWLKIPEKHFAIGSGGQLAIGAMSSGKTPKEAVMICSHHDIHTGMGALEFTLDTKEK